MRKILIILVISMLVGCIVQPQPKKNNKIVVEEISVPEEGANKLTRIVSKNDFVIIGPSIRLNKETNKLEWNTNKLIDISPDGKYIAFCVRSNGFDNLFIKELETAGKSSIQRTFNRNVSDFKFSPDSKNIVFAEFKESYGIYMISAFEGNAIQLIINNNNSNQKYPIFSPDGKVIYFSSNEGGTYYIWSINLENFKVMQLFEGMNPCLSPDGKFMLVTRANKQTKLGEIWKVDLEKGTEAIIMSSNNKSFSNPQISPDGKRVLCVSETPKDKTKDTNLDIYMFNIDGTRLVQLTYHRAHDVNPVWGTDGKSFYFISARGNKDGEYEIWKMDLNL